MVANIITTEAFNSIPRNWKGSFNYHKLDSSIHYADGWRSLIVPELAQNETVGTWSHDEDTDVCTYEIVQLSPEELDAKIPNTISKLNFKIGLLTNHGITNDQIQSFFKTNVTDAALKEQLKLLWFESSFFERKDPNLINFAPSLGLTEGDLNNIFINFNGY